MKKNSKTVSSVEKLLSLRSFSRSISISLVFLTACGFLLFGCKKNPNSNSVFAASENSLNSALNSDARKNVSEIFKDIPTVQAFLADEISESDLRTILESGINAQSGMNGQPWHFSVVKNKDLQNRVAEELRSFMPGNLPESVRIKAGFNGAPIAIVISGKENSDFDCGLAMQAMAFQSEILGYGTKIISSPNIVFHGENRAEYKSLLKIPEDMETISVLLVGKTDSEKSDAISSATTRKSYEEIVSIVE